MSTSVFFYFFALVQFTPLYPPSPSVLQLWIEPQLKMVIYFRFGYQFILEMHDNPLFMLKAFHVRNGLLFVRDYSLFSFLFCFFSCLVFYNFLFRVLELNTSNLSLLFLLKRMLYFLLMKYNCAIFLLCDFLNLR